MIAKTRSDAKWNRATKTRCCPVCEGTDNCESLERKDGFRLVYCGRETSGARKINGGGQGLHLLDPHGRIVPPGESSGRSERQIRPDLLPLDHPDFKCRDDLAIERTAKQEAQQAKQEAERLEAEKRQKEIAAAYTMVRTQLAEDGAEVDEENSLERLSEMLGVSVESLRAVGYVPATKNGQRGWAAPEWNAYGEIVGLSFRGIDGSKSFVRGGARGFTIAADWSSDRFGGQGPILVVEGASDVAACRDAGLTAIGRPNNVGGAGEQGIGEFLVNERQHHRQTIVVGENDQKPDGRWPGREGALSVANELREQLPRTDVSAAMLPAGVKDIRQYLATCSPEDIASGAAAERLLAELGANCIDEELPPRRTRKPSPAPPTGSPPHHPACRCDSCLEELKVERDEARQRCSFRRAVTNGEELVVLKLDCGTWKCPHCEPKLREMWTRHIQKVFSGCDWIYHRLVLSDREREAAMTAIRRRDGDALTINHGDGTRTIYSDVQPAGFSQMSPRAAAARAATELNISRCNSKRVATSRGWRLAKPGKKVTPWRLVKGNWNSNLAIKGAAELFKDRGLRVQIVEHDSRVLQLSIPGWPDYEIDYFGEVVTALANRWRQPENEDEEEQRLLLDRLRRKTLDGRDECRHSPIGILGVSSCADTDRPPDPPPGRRD